MSDSAATHWSLSNIVVAEIRLVSLGGFGSFAFSISFVDFLEQLIEL